MSPNELEKLLDIQLVENFKRAIELDVKNSGNGKNPFDQNQLKEELLRRSGKNQTLLQSSDEREVGDGHDEFS